MQKPEESGQSFPEPGASDVKHSQVGFLTARDPLPTVHTSDLAIPDPQQLLAHCLVSVVQCELKHTHTAEMNISVVS